MSVSERMWMAWLGCLVIGLWPGIGQAADAAAGDTNEGKQIFHREFAPGGASAGDGLGPLFNHRSCAACHLQGGAGGGGPVDVNVVLLSATMQPHHGRPEQRKLLTLLREQHPSFVTASDEITPTVVLHRFGLTPNYDRLRAKFIEPAIPMNPTSDERLAVQQTLARDAARAIDTTPLRLIMTQRNTTSLFGAGLIDSIPDSVLHTLAEEQKKQGEVSGRVPPVGADGAGRFGWRGQMERLHDFVLGACANELGLEVPGHEQPRDPLRPSYRPGGLDLTERQCAALTAFVASLPAPRMVRPEERERRELADRGRELFASVGCVACHVEQIGPVDGLYSDLLLHDLGAALVDPVAAEPTLVPTGRRLPAEKSVLNEGVSQTGAQTVSVPPPSPRPRGYSGGGQSQLVQLPGTILVPDPKTGQRVEFRVLESPLDREWRTPPLWGLADSAPYLHDGRAATVVEAVALHGGEAEACTKRFFALPLADRLSVLEFLSCLRAPQ